MCKKALDAPARACPRCRADLSLLMDHVGHLQDGLARADALTREGELAEAVWAYLEVLDVDPDNPVARRQVGRVATAVRAFDRNSTRRLWLKQARLRLSANLWAALGVLLVAVAAFVAGFELGTWLSLP